jgi:hypothetical protein
MTWLENVLNFVVETLLAEFVVVVAGVLFVRFIQHQWQNWRFGGWRVIITREGAEVLKRSISPRKAREILDEDADLAVFIKGVASPYEWIHCDPLEEGLKNGLLVVDKPHRRLVINLDHNPPGVADRQVEFEGS